ncbi:MAG: hypothetical protein A2268_14895 [Candidatus Raymondbacteria bacterium RifOxyA12_full_50_37]|uniref:Outer membrane protein beta-barrel domain-containing protein n=1 Tax=Candidatus Raymondbacteria bacterium RIFOXYD12_FULL_49_13 TaxID=1817890 RepID=A0A1F7F2I1_UNCRA|nr:MAG: hypothetical protein A2268_14895 [Candidatus Raymondbacteria bacterium RifOxyA12_full_50_37]OGJ87848.1 MAG: hypothetical protein A2350_12840 [Candidatus Raymondbacteria bacterium RifOxyB12_full_50_8]OGJ88702.1 MAG: hypothetical protein A2248_20830 [Candidatus Raymondbacteria bacterium RIFOXYA2_FULL_49_16]OGK00874.1 MAG: hypothetical protein A2519_08085 [Candidatus Raymondbacteria bacterium RIFOXYD12_FULL_49_13]OGK07501.1 MAG: hypothetical protein A2487_20000 [Candidatus Raymondbacteria 
MTRCSSSFLIFFSVIVFSAFAQDYVSKKEAFSRNSLLGGQNAMGLQQPAGSGLLDASHLTMHQSYTMSYASNGTQGDMTGLYLNRLQYQFSVPVTLQVDVGLFHKPLALAGKESGFGTGGQDAVLTVPRIGLFYKASENLFMSFEYINIPAGYSSMFMPYGAGYGMFSSPGYQRPLARPQSE